MKSIVKMRLIEVVETVIEKINAHRSGKQLMSNDEICLLIAILEEKIRTEVKVDIGRRLGVKKIMELERLKV